MALNFPASPEINDTYVADNGITYTFDGEKWVGQPTSINISSGFSGYSGQGFSGYSGYSGEIGFSGYSGYSGESISGFSGFSGYSGSNLFDQDLNTTDSPQFNRVGLTLGEINVTQGSDFDVYVSPDGVTSHNLRLDTNGDLTVPNYINFAGNTFIGDEPGAGTPVFRIVAPLGYGATIETDSDIEGTNRIWSFGVDGGLSLAGKLQFPNGAEIRDVNGDLRLRAASGDVAQLQGLTTDGAVDAAVKAFHDIETGSYVTINTNIDAGAPEYVWTFNYNGELSFPDATVQTTAFTGNAATVDITNTNGIDTNYSITFVETRDATQILRADVDLTFNSATNLLTTGNVAIKQTLTGGMDDGSDFIITSQPNPDRNNASNIGIYPGGATGTASESGFVLIQGGSSDVVGLAGGNVIIRGGAHTNSGVSGTIKVESVLKIDDGVHEKFQTKSDATGVVEHDCAAGHLFYHTSPDADWTANFTNLNLSSTYATAVTLIIAQGGTGYYPSAVQIGGVAQTINWQGNTTPTPSTNRTDVVTFSILNTGTGYVVLGQLTGF